MNYFSLFIATLYFITVSALANTDPAQKRLENLEKSFHGKIGIYAINTKNNEIIAYRADERFPTASTFKLLDVSALLKQSSSHKNLLKEKIHYTNNDLIFWHPVTGNHVASGMTLEALSEAAMSYSDNPAANFIMKKMGGPKSINDFAHSIGNKSFNIVHYEPNLNSDPKNEDDSSTPKDMAISLQKLTLGSALTKSQQTLLVTWMKNNTTSYKKMRAGAPIGWVVADKTGSGSYGIANDIGLLWSTTCKPIVLAIYTLQNTQDAKSRDDIVASATSIVIDELEKNDNCYQVKQ